LVACLGIYKTKSKKEMLKKKVNGKPERRPAKINKSKIPQYKKFLAKLAEKKIWSLGKFK